MKKVKRLIPFAIVLMFVFILNIGTFSIANATQLSSSTTYPLTAGKTNVIGTVTVTLEGTNLLVTYHTDTLNMTENQLNITTTIPTDKGEPGHYTYTSTGTVKDFTFTVPLGTYTAGQTIYLMAHTTAAGETAYGGTIVDLPQEAWFGYIPFTIPAVTIVKGNLEVKYVDENGKNITNPLETTENVGINYTTIQKPFDGYEFVSVTGAPNGTYLEGTTTVVYAYKEVPTTEKLVVKYENENGTNLITPLETTAAIGSAYSTDKKTFNGYDFVSVTENASGSYKEGTTLVIYKYIKKVQAVTQETWVVKYVDEFGNNLVPKTITKQNVETAYSTIKKNIIGYDFVNVVGDKKGSSTSGQTTVTFNYKKSEVPTLPKTGGIPAGVFYGFGSIIVGLGTTLRFISKK